LKFSEAWLREFVNPSLTTQELVDQLTMAGLEVDGFEAVAAHFTQVVVAEILETSPHPDADKLKVCRVNAGEEEVQIVCGASNARAGIKVPLARLGARLEDFKIKKAKLRGVESFGMLCSERELGLSESHEGLMELPADAPVGVDVRAFLQLDDAMIDLDLTPNRSDCLGMVGLARETGVINGLDVLPMDVPAVVATHDKTFSVNLNAGEACPRFVGRVITGIRLDAKTPLWMVEKLRRSGVRSIDPVVDVTNYVMLELGQPMHAYDVDRLQGEISVRVSAIDETVTLLDGQDITLHPDTLLITDQSGPIGIAGIMGGLSTSVTATTTNIFFECAFFAPMAIVGRARAYGMNTDASHRFERGVDWQGQVRAIERATALLLEIAGGEPGPTVDTANTQDLPVVAEVTLRGGRIERLLGVVIADTQVDEILARLGFENERRVVDGHSVWQVRAPSHRFDIAIEADLIEEVSRVYGYNNLPVRTPRAHLVMAPIHEDRLDTNRVKDQLVSLGYQEAITYSFVEPKMQAIIDPQQTPISLANPISAEMAVMRTTLWSGLLKALIYNSNRQQNRIRLFETGLRFRQLSDQPELLMENIQQERVLAGVVCGPRYPESWAVKTAAVDFYDVKADVEAILDLTGMPEDFIFSAAECAALHPGQCAGIYRNGSLIGHVGLLDPRAQQALDLDQPVFLFELTLEGLQARRVPNAAPLSRFPEVRRDVAIIVDAGVHAAEINACVAQAADETFRNLKLFDVYQGKGIDPNRKSIALGLTFQHVSRTLTDEEISVSVNEIVAALETKLAASLRN
jgi:phenylalanyl-tRNA synthetase beta chain